MACCEGSATLQHPTREYMTAEEGPLPPSPSLTISMREPSGVKARPCAQRKAQEETMKD